MSQDEFIEKYVTTFLATWAANAYDSACARGEQKRLNNPPVEDALYFGQWAWWRVMEHAEAGFPNCAPVFRCAANEAVLTCHIHKEPLVLFVYDRPGSAPGNNWGCRSCANERTNGQFRRTEGPPSA